MTSTEKEVAFRKRRRDYAIHRPKNAIRANTEIIKGQRERFIRPELLLARARKTKADKRRVQINMKRQESANFPQPPELAKVALVIRLAPKKASLCSESGTIFAEMHLLDQFDGCFVVLDETNRTKLRTVSHLIAYGMPAPETVRQLIHTKAQIVRNGVEVPITANKTVSDALGSVGIEGLSDIVYAINKGASTVTDIAGFLAPFHFNDPKTTGQSGWCDAAITEFVEKIL